MDVIEKFGNRVSSQALKDPEKARRLLLAGYRLQEKKLQFLPDRGLPSSGQYVARVVMKNIILFDVNQQHFDHSVAVGTGECGDGQHICAGRAGDGGRADAVLSGGDVLFYGGNEV